MLGFIATKLLQSTNGYKAVKFRAFHSSTATLKSSTPLQFDSKGDAFTVSFLVISCSVDVDAANKISKKIQLKSAEKPSRTLNFLRSYGFTDAQISTIITVAPNVLHSHPVKTLKPKFDLFTSVDASHEAVVQIIRQNPQVSQLSLEKRLVPVLDLIKTIVASNEELVTLLTRSCILDMNLNERLVPVLDLIKSIVGSNEELIALITRHRIIQRNSWTTLGPNVAFMRNIGMTDHSILRFLMVNGNSIGHGPVKFKAMSDRALAMGFDVEKTSFGDAIAAFTALTKENWDKKVEIFRKWGWSENEFNVAFRKKPRIMLLSESNIEGTMDYLVDKMGVDAALLARSPYILMYSLKKRIIPRCSVLRVMLSKGLIEKDHFMYSMTRFRISDESFLKEYVEKHAGVRSELLTLYRSLMH